MDKLFGRAKSRLSRTLSSATDKTKADMDDKRGLAASNPFSNTQVPALRITAAADDAPPPYTVAPPQRYGSVTPPASEYTLQNLRNHEDPYYFLYLFDTIFLIDDSSSMVGARWREVQAALSQIVPVCTSHDDDGIDVHFMNHKSTDTSAQDKATGGYYNITEAADVKELFRMLRPCGPTPTRGRLEDILDPYVAQLGAAADVSDVKPLNIIVLTDGRPGPSRADGSNPHMPEPAIVKYARELDRLRAPPYQVGIQFIQIGNDTGATAMLEALDDGLPSKYGCRDICDTLKFGQGGYMTLTADQILKAVIGGVNRRLDNRSFR